MRALGIAPGRIVNLLQQSSSGGAMAISLAQGFSQMAPNVGMDTVKYLNKGNYQVSVYSGVGR